MTQTLVWILHKADCALRLVSVVTGVGALLVGGAFSAVVLGANNRTIVC